MSFNNSKVQALINKIKSQILDDIEDEIEEHNVVANSSRTGHVQAGSSPQDINTSGTSNAGTDNGYYARADHVHKIATASTTGKGIVQLDSTPTANSSNGVTSNGIKSALDGKSDTGHTHSGYATIKAVEDYVNNKVDASFKVEVIQNYTVQYLENDYGYTDGNAFSEYLSDAGISYDANTIYLLRNQTDFPSFYNEYILIDDTHATPVFELLGTTQIDITWSSITGKPSTFTPSSHNHGNISNTGTLSGKSQNVVTDSNGVITTEAKPTIPTTSDLINLVYPVGSIYMSVNSTDPLTLFGFGTWEQLQNRFLLGAGSSYTNGDTGGASTVSLTESQMPRHTHIQNAHTHTQKEHTHTQNAHTHTQNEHTHTQDAHTHTQDAHNHSQNAHSHQVPDIFSGGTGGESRVIKTTGRKGGYRPWTTDATATNIATTATNQNTTATNQNTTATNQKTTATNQNTQAINQNTTATNQYTGGTGTIQSASNGSAHNNMPPYLVVYMWKRTA